MSETGVGPPAETGARELLIDLVSIPSPSGEEAAVAERLVEFFEGSGRTARIDDAGNVRAPGDDSVLLTSHLDTVPGEIPVEVAPAEDGNEADAQPALWGRGSVDATGSLAAMAWVAVRTGVSFAGVVREETDSLGARHLVADRPEPDAVVNGEPSGWSAFTLGYRGYLAGTYELSTRAGHHAGPGSNAIQSAMDWWTDVRAVLRTDESDGDGDHSPFESVTATPLAVEGGRSADGRTVEASLDFEVRVPPGRDPDELRSEIAGVTDAGTVDWDLDATVPPAVETPRNPLARAFRAAIRDEGGEPTMLHKTGTADANLYAEAWDCPVVTYGPGDAELDHAPDEHLPLSSFDRAVAVLETVTDELTEP